MSSLRSFFSKSEPGSSALASWSISSLLQHWKLVPEKANTLEISLKWPKHEPCKGLSKDFYLIYFHMSWPRICKRENFLMAMLCSLIFLNTWHWTFTWWSSNKYGRPGCTTSPLQHLLQGLPSPYPGFLWLPSALWYIILEHANKLEGAAQSPLFFQLRFLSHYFDGSAQPQMVWRRGRDEQWCWVDQL